MKVHDMTTQINHKLLGIKSSCNIASLQAKKYARNPDELTELCVTMLAATIQEESIKLMGSK